MQSKRESECINVVGKPDWLRNAQIEASTCSVMQADYSERMDEHAFPVLSLDLKDLENSENALIQP